MTRTLSRRWLQWTGLAIAMTIFGCQRDATEPNAKSATATLENSQGDGSTSRTIGSFSLPIVDTTNVEPPIVEQIAELEARFERATIDDAGKLYGKLGMMYQCLEVHWAAKNCYKAAAEASPEDYRWPFLLGHLARLAGDPDQATQRFSQALELIRTRGGADRQPEITALCWLGETALSQGRWTLAENRFQQVLEIDPDQAFAHYSLGRIAEQQDQLDSAVNHLQQANRLEPEVSSIQYLLGTVYHKLGREALAIALLQSSTANRQPYLPSDALLWEVESSLKSYRRFQFIADQNFKAGQYQVAVDSYRQALHFQATPEALAQTHCNLGSALSKLGDHAEAVKHWKQAAAFSPDHTPTLLNLAEFAAATGQETQAIEIYQSIIARLPDHRKARRKLAEVLARHPTDPATQTR
ncbi:tetratricopeptide repeat protein [Roseiconus nitratireducens]|uniref:Tetratricopeptide repeat protein n=1 Tax=Roseiconus nitratireducens TaxID=2605748 RepID=A0A5M6CVF0_9BACT|nr:tetratricopeptide repeat protein [Roseiconus nitratireducens]KAA5539204.1 tetratricopeptide repeat protein [Roseiconus nitratireducens]